LAGLPGLVLLTVAEQIDQDVFDDIAGVFRRGESFVDRLDKPPNPHGRIRGQRDVSLRHCGSVAGRM